MRQTVTDNYTSVSMRLQTRRSLCLKINILQFLEIATGQTESQTTTVPT